MQIDDVVRARDWLVAAVATAVNEDDRSGEVDSEQRLLDPREDALRYLCRIDQAQYPVHTTQ